MSKRGEPISAENAQRAAERFFLDTYPYANIVFERAELKTSAAQQVYEFAGYSRLSKWPKATAVKRLCEIQVDAHSADIIGYHGV